MQFDGLGPHEGTGRHEVAFLRLVDVKFDIFLHQHFGGVVVVVVMVVVMVVVVVWLWLQGSLHRDDALCVKLSNRNQIKTFFHEQPNF